MSQNVARAISINKEYCLCDVLEIDSAIEVIKCKKIADEHSHVDELGYSGCLAHSALEALSADLLIIVLI